MRILHVIPTLRLADGGPTKALLEMCAYLNGAGHQTAIYTTDLDGDGGRSLAGQADDLDVTFFPVRAPKSLKFSPALANALSRNVAGFDIVHINSLYLFPSTIAAYYARRHGKPYIIRPHGTLDPYIFARHRKRKYLYEILFERRNLRHAAAVHFTSLEEMQLAGSSGLPFRGVVVPLGARLPDHNLANAREKLARWYPQTRDKHLVLYLGRLNFKKGLDLLAKAFGEVCRNRHDAHLLIAGPDNEGYRPQVEKWLQDEGAAEHATLAGMVTGEKKAALLQGADLMVLPSYSENFGNAVVEAMASELPVIISNKVNIWREVQEGGAGAVINCSAEELATEIHSLLDNATLRRNMGKRGKQLVAQKFTWEIAGAQLVALYRSVLQGEPTPFSSPRSLDVVRPLR